MLHCAVLTVLVAGRLTAEVSQASLIARISTPSIPPGGKAQIQVYLAVPHAFVSGRIIMDFDAAVFGDVSAADMFSATGDQAGSAKIKGSHVEVQFSSPTGGVGRLPNVPVLTVAVPVLDTAADQAVGNISVTVGDAPWIDAGGYRYAVMAKSSSLTVGGSLSVEEVRQGSGMLPAGSVVSVYGTGFTAATTVQVDGVSFESVQVAAPGRMNLTLRAPTDLTGKHVIVRNPDGAMVDYVSSLRGFVITRPGYALNAIQPIFPQQTYAAASLHSVDYRGLPPLSRAFALENQSLNEVTVTIDALDNAHYNTAERSTLTLPSGAIYRAYQPVHFPHGTYLYVYASEPIRIVELFGENSEDYFGSFAIPTVPFHPLVDSTDGYLPLSWDWQAGSSVPLPRSLVVTMEDAPTPFETSATTASGGQWLSVSPTNGTSCYLIGLGCSIPSKITVTVDPSSLAPGVYSGTITVNPTGIDAIPTTLSVSLHVSVEPVTGIIGPLPPLPLTASPASMVFSVNAGAPPPKTQFSQLFSDNAQIQIRLFDSGVSVSTNSGGNWLSAKVDQSLGGVAVNVNPAGVSAGAYEGVINVAPQVFRSPYTVGTAQIPVKLIVSNNPVPAGSAAPSPLVFSAPSGGKTLQTLRFGTSIPWTASASTEDDGGWLVATTPYIAPGAIFTQQVFDIMVNAWNMAPGAYQGMVKIAAPAGSANPVIVPVTLTVTAALPVLPQPGPPLAAFIVNGASARVGAVAQGEIITILGQNIGPSDPAGFSVDPDGRLATNLGGARVLFNGFAAPLLYASATQVDAIVPYELTTSGVVTVEVEYNSARAPAGGLVLAPAAPAIFTLDSTGQGQAKARNADGSMNSPQNPAARGSVIQIDATGEGVTSPPGITGDLTPGVARKPALPVKVTIGGDDAPVQSALSAPDTMSGVLLVNALIPRDIAPGEAVPIMLTIGGTHGQDGVTIAVK